MWVKIIQWQRTINADWYPPKSWATRWTGNEKFDHLQYLAMPIFIAILFALERTSSLAFTKASNNHWFDNMLRVKWNLYSVDISGCDSKIPPSLLELPLFMLCLWRRHSIFIPVNLTSMQSGVRERDMGYEIMSQILGCYTGMACGTRTLDRCVGIWFGTRIWR